MRDVRKFFVRTYGCQMNELDSEIMVGMLEKRGLIRTEEESDADLLIFNTCSIRDLAERKVLGKLGQLGRISKNRPVIGVTGCMANAKKEALFQKLPHIDFVLGTNNIHDLNNVLDDVLLTGKEMKDIGLVDKITKVNPTEVKAFNERMFAIAAEHAPKPNINPNSNIMTVAEIKAQHPALYAEIFGLGVTAGTSEERDRVGSWLPFASVDAELVSKSIKEGTKLSASAMSEMNVKMISAQGLKKIEADAPGAVKTEEPKTEKDKGVAAFEASVDKALGKKAIA